MQDDDENDGTIVRDAQELLTAKDCDSIIHADGCQVGYAWPCANKPSSAMLGHVKNFAGTVRLAALVYDVLSTEEQLWLCEGLRQISEEMAGEGYLTKYGVYTTEELNRGCVVLFRPIQVPHDGTLRVPRRFEELVPKKCAPSMNNDHERAKC
jgi:hypothetical protein